MSEQVAFRATIDFGFGLLSLGGTFFSQMEVSSRKLQYLNSYLEACVMQVFRWSVSKLLPPFFFCCHFGHKICTSGKSKFLSE
jgi:hypothetical protein